MSKMDNTAEQRNLEMEFWHDARLKGHNFRGPYQRAHAFDQSSGRTRQGPRAWGICAFRQRQEVRQLDTPLACLDPA